MRYIAVIFAAVVLSTNCMYAQSNVPFFVAAGGSKTFDLLAPYYPYSATAHLKVTRLYLSGSYSASPSSRNQYQPINPSTSKSIKIGYMKGNRSASVTAGGLVFGYADENVNRKFNFDMGKYPVNEFGKTQEIEFAVVNVHTKTYSVGFSYFIFEHKENKYMEYLADEYDIEKIGKKERRTLTSFSFDVLYAPFVEYDKTFIYSPFANYVPQQMQIIVTPKIKRVGVRLKAEYVTFSGLGFHMEMGILPGIAQKTGYVNDFGFSTRVGLMYYLYYAK
jgi:hypothetical protein